MVPKSIPYEERSNDDSTRHVQRDGMMRTSSELLQITRIFLRTEAVTLGAENDLALVHLIAIIPQWCDKACNCQVLSLGEQSLAW